MRQVLVVFAKHTAESTENLSFIRIIGSHLLESGCPCSCARCAWRVGAWRVGVPVPVSVSLFGVESGCPCSWVLFLCPVPVPCSCALFLCRTGFVFGILFGTAAVQNSRCSQNLPRLDASIISGFCRFKSNRAISTSPQSSPASATTGSMPIKQSRGSCGGG